MSSLQKEGRLFHSFSPRLNNNNHDNIIKVLYKNRIAPIKIFDLEVVDTCKNITSNEQRSLFFNKYNNKGGIYLIQFKEDLSVYYIGRSNNFKKRLQIHLKTRLKDKFHLFANLVGWDQFDFSIVEICDLNLQLERENFYLQKYLPLLNTVFKSSFSDSKLYDTLYSKLKSLQKKLEFNNKHIGVPLHKVACLYLFKLSNK